MSERSPKTGNRQAGAIICIADGRQSAHSVQQIGFFLMEIQTISVGSCNWAGNWTSWYQPTVVRAIAVFSQPKYLFLEIQTLSVNQMRTKCEPNGCQDEPKDSDKLVPYCVSRPSSEERSQCSAERHSSRGNLVTRNSVSHISGRPALRPPFLPLYVK